MPGSTAIRLALLCLAFTGCTQPAAAPAKRYVLRIAVTDPYLKATYSQLSDISIEDVTPAGASVLTVMNLQRGIVDVSVALADAAYLGYTGQLEEAPGPFDQLRGMAVLDLNTLHLLVGTNTHIHSIDQLNGRHVALGPSGSSGAVIAETLLKANGLTVDAAFVIQIPGNGPVMQATRGGARLLDVDGPLIEEIRQHRPYLRRTLIPKGVYPGQDKPIRTIGVDRVLICRADVPEGIVYRLLDAYFSARPEGTPPADLERAPATPLPLHPGAARYYRQRELSR